MEQGIRRREYNRIMDEIRHIDMVVEKSEAAASRMRYQAESDFIMTQLSKIKEKNIERRESKDKLTERLEHLNGGLLDAELRAGVREQMAEANEKTRVTRQKKKELAADKAAKSVISKAYYQASRRQDRQNKYANKNMNRSYRHFCRACNSIPDYMRRNLSEMPNNKGYFWKSVACYGNLPAERGKPTVLFDRRRGGIMVIHEWTPNEYKVYEKKGKDRKVLVSCTKRRHRELPPVCVEMQRREKEEAERLANRPRKRSSGRKSSGGRSTRSRPRENRTRPRENRTRPRGRSSNEKTQGGLKGQSSSRWEPVKGRSRRRDR